MNKRLVATGLSGAALLAACAAPAPQPPGPPVTAVPPATTPAPAALMPSLTLEGYKKSVAERIALASPDVFGEPLPETLKSIVVLDITIDRGGNLAHVSVRRSNGYKALEIAALNSVRRAAPYAAPAWPVRRADGSVSFLETFLFRDDGRFQIRSLVAAR